MRINGWGFYESGARDRGPAGRPYTFPAPRIAVGRAFLRILHAVEFYAPSCGGAQEVVRRLSEEMVAHGHEVTVATTRLPGRHASTMNGVRLVEFDVSGNAVYGIRGDVGAYVRFLLESRFDVVMTYASQQWTTDAFLDVADAVSGVKICAPCGYSGLGHPDYREYFEHLPDRLRRLDATVYHSPTYRDAVFARTHGLSKIHVIPNGAALAEFEDPDPEGAADFRRRHGIRGLFVLTVGSHAGLKGHRSGMVAFATAPGLRNATLAVVGDGIPGEGCAHRCPQWVRRLGPVLHAQGKRIALLDLPREEVVRAFKAADVFLFLSRLECSPIVLFEAAASGTPFVTSDVGNAAEIAGWTGAGVVVPMVTLPGDRVIASPWRASRELTRLARGAGMRRALGVAGREAWRARFTWEAIACEYLDLYEEMAGRKATLEPSR